MNTVDVLRAARERIEKGWCQGDYARSKHGRVVDSDDPEAALWCASGALWAEVDLSQIDVYGHAQSLLERYVADDCIEDWNDAPGRDKAEVLNLFDKAIEEAKG